MTRGYFITLEGGEGAGKSTNLALIETLLREAGCEVVVTREPGGTAVGERIRDILLHAQDLHIAAETELLLMFAARTQHLQQVIAPALASGKMVLCDRFTDASYAYQGAGRGIATERIAQLEFWVQGELRPDLTLLFDIPVEQGLARAGTRSPADRFESEQQAFFERIRLQYLARAEAEPKRIKRIDAAQGLEAVQQDVRHIMKNFLSEVRHG